MKPGITNHGIFKSGSNVRHVLPIDLHRIRARSFRVCNQFLEPSMMRWVVGVPTERPVRASVSAEIHVIQNRIVNGPVQTWTLRVVPMITGYRRVALGLPSDPRRGRTQLDHIDPVHRYGDVTTARRSIVDAAQKNQCYSCSSAAALYIVPSASSASSGALSSLSCGCSIGSGFYSLARTSEKSFCSRRVKGNDDLGFRYRLTDQQWKERTISFFQIKIQSPSSQVSSHRQTDNLHFRLGLVRTIDANVAVRSQADRT